MAQALGWGIGPGEGVTAGKLHYLSPEQSRCDTLTQASDLFSLGIVLHELLLGTHPFERDSEDPEVVMASIRAAKLHLPDSLDKRLAAVLRKALAPDVSQRYRTAGEFAGALFAWVLDSNHPAPPQQALARALREQK